MPEPQDDVVFAFWKFEAVFIDGERQKARVSQLVKLDSSMALPDVLVSLNAWGVLLVAMSKGALIYLRVSSDVFKTVNTPALGVDADAEDGVSVTFLSNVDGTRTATTIPMPIDEVFLGDGETIDPSDGVVQNWITWVHTHGVTKSHANELVLESGIKHRGKPRRRLLHGVPSEIGG